MDENPFAPHSPAPPGAFVNRDREIDLVYSHIRAAQRGNVAVNGPLGIGKTSLLRYIADPHVAIRHGVTTAQLVLLYLDVQSVSPFEAAQFWRRVAQRLARMPMEGLDEPIARLAAIQTLDIVDVEEFLDALADQGLALVILADEFEWALQADSAAAEAASRDFLAQMASLARRAPRVLSLVVATESSLHEATKVIESWRGSPFATLFTSVTLRPLSPKDADCLLERALGTGSTHFEASEREFLYTCSGGHPGALQAAAFALFQDRQQGLPPDHLLQRARAAAEEARRDLMAVTDLSPRLMTVDSAGTTREAGPPTQTGPWINERTGEVWVNGTPTAPLTPLEYSLLRLLLTHQGRLCNKNDIIRQVWGEEFMGEVDDSRVEKLVSRLRRKIEAAPGRPQHIRTVRGRGYRFVP